MSNTQHANGAAAYLYNDVGLGYCLACLTEQQPRPRFACTMAPMQLPVPGPGGGVAGVAFVVVPSCVDHLRLHDAPSRLVRG
jgi:hypothetical protein